MLQCRECDRQRSERETCAAESVPGNAIRCNTTSRMKPRLRELQNGLRQRHLRYARGLHARRSEDVPERVAVPAVRRVDDQVFFGEVLRLDRTASRERVRRRDDSHEFIFKQRRGLQPLADTSLVTTARSVGPSSSASRWSICDERLFLVVVLDFGLGVGLHEVRNVVGGIL